MTLHKLAYMALSLLLISFVFFLIPHVFSYMLPFIIALILAVLIEPIVEMAQKWLKIDRKWASPLIFSLFMIIFLGLTYLLTAKIIVELVALFERLPAMLESMAPLIQNFLRDVEQLYLLVPEEAVSSIASGLEQMINWLQRAAQIVGTALISIAAGLPAFLIVSLIVVISFALMSYQLPILKANFLGLFEENTAKKVEIMMQDLNQAVVGFVRAQIILSFLTYMLALVGLWILGVKYALAISFIIVLVDILPILGTGSVIVPWSLFQLFVRGDEFVGIGLLVLYVIINIFRRIVEPKILGDNIGLGTLAVIISMWVGLQAFGILGLFIGPLLFILIKAMRKAGMLQKKIEF
ncbi:MAG: sporulation integral membrane protein YtvI [Bacillaceae bacterium]|nr:sporulation integral membrane protein YtvI [Bacillaceae bacterium]